MPTLAAMAETVGALLKERGETVAVSESSTGGLIAAALLAVPGASAYFVGGGVIYTHKAREVVLLERRLEDHPGMRASTEPYARLCATAIRERLGTTWGLGETGATGPSGNRYGDPPGHSCIAIAGPHTRSITLETGQSDREANMWRFARAALDLLEQAIRGS
jgi:nicotinamide-nucleotide amidase